MHTVFIETNNFYDKKKDDETNEKCIDHSSPLSNTLVSHWNKMGL